MPDVRVAGRPAQDRSDGIHEKRVGCAAGGGQPRAQQWDRSRSRRNDHQLPRATRALTADETIARVLAHKDVLGITRVANLTGLDRTGIPVVMVCRPNARSSAVFNGKGIDIAAAKASALMEAAETWHAEHVRALLRLATFAEMREDWPVVDVDGLSSRQVARELLALLAPV